MPRPSSFVVGAVFDRLTALHKTATGRAQYACICGVTKEMWVCHVQSGKSRSCGCMHREIVSALLTARQTRHGKAGTPVYSTWVGMLQRCTNSKHEAFADYGGRGITVCSRWAKFENFYTDMGDPPAGLTLERRENNQGYSKANCFWATYKEQQNNKRNNVLVTYEGRTQNITQWAEELYIPRGLLYDRFSAGWPAAKALTQPSRKRS